MKKQDGFRKDIMKKRSLIGNVKMKNLLVILSAIYFLAVPLNAQDAAVSFENVITQPGTEVVVPLHITDLQNVGSASIFIQFDREVLTFIGIENSSFAGMLENLLENELRTSWFSLMPVDLSDKVFDIRFMYNGGSTDLILTQVEITDNLSQPYELAVQNGSVGDGAVSSELALTAPAGGEEWIAGTVQNITWNSTDVNDVMIEYSTDAGSIWNNVGETVATAGMYEWTIPDTPTKQALVRISDADDAGVNSQSETNFTILPQQVILFSPVVADIPDQRVKQCESFEAIKLDDYVTDEDDQINKLIWTSSGEKNLIVSIDENRNAVITLPNDKWTGSETITFTAADANGASDSDDVVFTVMEDDGSPDITCPPDVTLELISSSVTYSGPAAEAADYCDSEVVITSDPELPVIYNSPGEYTIIWTATDASGNSADCTQSITIYTSDTGNEANMTSISLIMSELLATITGEKKVNNKIEKAAKHLRKSLKSDYWIDENHLSQKKGKKVFDYGKKAVKELKKILKHKNVDEGIEVIIESNIHDLLSVYHSLALISIQEAESDCTNDKCGRKIKKRYKELKKAEKEIAKGHPERAIDRYKKAWEYGRKKGKRTKKQLSDAGRETAVDTPLDYNLVQNYPNPFNPSTLISFSTPEAGSVRLVVFNMIGEEVEVLVNGIYSAGYHTVQFNANNLNAGIYLYRLETDNYVDIKKMMLVK